MPDKPACLANGIPKILHQTWKTHDVPLAWKPAQVAWTTHHPDWIYCFWTDQDLSDYILEKHPEFWHTYTHFSYHIQRVDAVRYFFMKDFGGVYADLDLMPNQPLDAHLEAADADVCLVKSANEPCYTNMLMASRGPTTRRVHDDCVWSRMIRSMVVSVRDPQWYFVLSKHFHVMMSTGPLALTRAADSYTGVIAVLSKQRFNPFGILEAGDLETQQLYKYPVVYVLEGSSWHAWDSQAINWLLRYKWWVVTVLVLLLIASIVMALQAKERHEELRQRLRSMVSFGPPIENQ